MHLTRRQLLMICGVSGLGLAFVGKGLSNSAESNAGTDHLLAQNPPKTPSPPVNPNELILRFAAIADTGSGNARQFAVGKAMADFHTKNPYSLVVMAGDNIYTNGEISKIGAVFEQPYAELLKRGVRFQAALGNHDIRYQNGEAQLKYAPFNMKGRHYSFQAKSVQFFVLDTNEAEAQLPWLEQELMRSKATVKVVYGHHPIYSSGLYGTNQEMIAGYTPLFKKYQVQLYINGHEHHYERTKPIDGTTYLITGHGGASLRSVGKSTWTEHSASRYGFSIVEIYPNRIEIQGIGEDGTIFDRGSVPLKVSAV